MKRIFVEVVGQGAGDGENEKGEEIGHGWDMKGEEVTGRR